MKTGKKLLSLFLAVVMMVTTCSVGFTAFAADKDKGIWKNSTSADSTGSHLCSGIAQSAEYQKGT